MKRAKFRLMINSIILVLSIGGLIASIIFDIAFLIGFFSSIIGASIVGLFKLYKITRSEEKAKEYEILEKDERIKLIANESKAISFNVLLVLLLGSSIVGYVISNEILLIFSFSIVLVATTLYFITTVILNKIK